MVLATFSLGVLTTAVALQPSRIPQDSLLPADGAVQTVEVEGLPGQVETAALQGRQIRGLGGLGVLAAETVPPEELPDTQWWRLGFTVADPPAMTGGSGPVLPTTEFLLLRGDASDLDLVGISLQHLGWVYTDPVPLSASGEQELTGRYTPASGKVGRHRTRVLTSTADGCRRAEIRSDLDGLEVNLDLELCEGRFVRFDIAIPGGGASDFVAVDRTLIPFDGELAPSESRPVEGGWEHSSASMVIADSALGGAAGWDLVSYLDPVALRDETMVVARYGSQDLIAVAPEWEDGDLARIRWVAHPGGTIRSLVAAGDLTVVATSERRLVGYGPNGIRHWQLELSDLVAPPLVTDGSGVLYAATLNGQVSAVDLRTGELRWQEEVGDHLLTGPGPVPEGGVVVGTAEGSLIRLAADGRTLWSHQLEVSRPAVELVAATSDQVFAVTREIRAHALDDGSEQWSISLGSATALGLVTPDAMVGLATSSGVWALDRGWGEALWASSERAEAVRARGGVLFSFRPGAVEAGVVDGTRVSWPVAGLSPHRGRCMCARTADGWLFSTGTTVARLR